MSTMMRNEDAAIRRARLALTYLASAEHSLKTAIECCKSAAPLTDVEALGGTRANLDVASDKLRDVVAKQRAIYEAFFAPYRSSGL